MARLSAPTRRISEEHRAAGMRAAGMAAGVSDGLSAFVRLWSGHYAPRRYPLGGIKSDWLAVGRDLQSALSSWKVDETS